MKIKLSGIYVDDQNKALQFYTDILGFVKKSDIQLGSTWWLTVVSPDEPHGTELLLETAVNPAVQAFKKAMYEQGLPYTAFEVENIDAEYERLKNLGVVFRMEPAHIGLVTLAVLDDTCGNCIQIYQVPPE